MKKSIQLAVLSVFVSFTVESQVLDFNNVSAIINNSGQFFNNPVAQTAGYEIPKSSGLNAIYAASLWCAATDANGQLHLAAIRYGQVGNDFFPGPFSSTNNYTSASYLSEYGTSIWQVTKVEVQNHLANYTSSGYVMPVGIATWPGNGISGAGIAQNLAPFVDMNNNSIYEPMMGDYPDIRGDMTVYTIMNDAANLHTETGGEIIGIEVHTMAYQYFSTDYLNNTTFLHYRVFNRGTLSYSNFKLGMWWDPDLGNPSDDYVGCDTLNNMMYVYNADNNDENSGIAQGYGANPPALGIRSLTKKMEYFTYFTNGASFPYTDPSVAAQYYNYMNGLWAIGTQMYYGGNGTTGSVPTNYIFPGNPNLPYQWSESDTMSSHSPGDRRGVMTLEEESLPAGAKICYDFAVLYAREPGNNVTNNKTNVNALINIAITAKTDFDAMTTYNCDQVTLGLERLDETQIGLYPNPTTGTFTLSFGNEAISGEVFVSDMNGRIIFQEKISSVSSKTIQLDANNGVYYIFVRTDKGTVHKKLMLTK